MIFYVYKNKSKSTQLKLQAHLVLVCLKFSILLEIKIVYVKKCAIVHPVYYCVNKIIIFRRRTLFLDSSWKAGLFRIKELMIGLSRQGSLAQFHQNHCIFWNEFVCNGSLVNDDKNVIISLINECGYAMLNVQVAVYVSWVNCNLYNCLITEAITDV